MPTPPIAQRPACPLEGRWAIDRRVRGLRGGRDATFTGTAEIGPDADASGSLAWREEGLLQSAAHTGRATRVLRIVPAGEAWEVLFEDGRPFHPLDLRTGRCDVVHLCGADHYAGTVRVDGTDALEVRWRVTGPAKEMEIVSAYRRIPAG